MLNRTTAVIAALVGFTGLIGVTAGNGAMAAGDAVPHTPRQHWSFSGFNGQFDRAQLRRGFQNYEEVCASCHGLKRVYFRNLTEPGGPEFPIPAIKKLAKDWDNQITDGPNGDGEMYEREPRLSDPILGPYANDNAARAANNGALPPDLSLIIKARAIPNHSIWYVHVYEMARDIVIGYQEGGADYVYAVLTGYTDAPQGVTLAEGMHYNTGFPGHQIAMGAPIPEGGIVEYQDDAGATMSLEQNARDVVAFLAWTGDPSLNERKILGWQVLLYLLITTILLYIGKKRIWSRIKH